METRTWRKTRQSIKGRTYWSLQAGARGKDRVALALGYCTEDEADRALVTIQDEEAQAGTMSYDRVLRLYARDKQAAREYLIGDRSMEVLFGKASKVEPSWMHLPIRDYVADHYGPARAETKPKTWPTERIHWDRILDQIGDHSLGEVDEFLVDDLLTRMLRRKDGKKPSPNMQRHCRNAIRAMLTWARRKRHYKRPMPQFFRLEGTGHKPARIGEDKYLSLQELADLLENTRLPMHRAIFASCAGLGLRPNEATVMRWEDIDWHRGTLEIRGTKTDGSAARVPLLPIAKGALEAWWMECGQPTQGPCYVSERGQPYATGTPGGGGHVGWRKALNTALEASSISKRVTPYTLRHTAATLLVQQGVSVDSVAKLLRHSSPRMVQQVYDHTGATLAPGLVALAPSLPAG